MSQSQKNFSSFKNSFGGQNLGIIHKKVVTEGDCEIIEDSLPEKESEKLEEESEREKGLGVSTSTNTVEASFESRKAGSSVSEASKSTGGEVDKPQCLVSYEMSTSDSDDSG